MLGPDRSGQGAVPSKCSALISRLEIKMQKRGLCPPRALGLGWHVTCHKANLVQYCHCCGAVCIRGDSGGEQRLHSSSWRSLGRLHRGGSMQAENRKKHPASPGTDSGQPVQVTT